MNAPPRSQEIKLLDLDRGSVPPSRSSHFVALSKEEK